MKQFFKNLLNDLINYFNLFALGMLLSFFSGIIFGFGCWFSIILRQLFETGGFPSIRLLI